jgi:dTDP-4-dehydrorhamnose 3,5-epimerase
MIFRETTLSGAYSVEIEQISDERGFFARSFCTEEFSKYGLTTDMAQCNISFNKTRGTLRGMHYQAPPSEEAKLVRCTMGAIYDVIIDIRPTSPTFMKWFATQLNSENRLMMAIPEGFAHGFQTLTDNTEVSYHMSASYEPQQARGIRFDDPSVNIEWPISNVIVSEKDKSYPLLDDESDL